MHPLRILGYEHGLIRQYLDNLRYAVDRLERGDRPAAQFFENAVLFAGNLRTSTTTTKKSIRCFGC